MYRIIILSLSLLVLSCGQKTKENNTPSSIKTEKTSYDESKIGRQNFAIIWNWTTTDVQLVSDNSVAISEELTKLWKEDIVENAYYNGDSKVDKLAHFPNISFFIKAKSFSDVESILNKLTVVKKGIASYQIFPVGHLWLDRKEEVINKNGVTKSYVTIWKTNNNPTDELTKSQNDKVLELWNSGKIENVYFDIEGTQTSNNKTDFVFYVNTNSEEEANALCKSLPFFRENISTYEIHEVGVFWLGKYQNQ